MLINKIKRNNMKKRCNKIRMNVEVTFCLFFSVISTGLVKGTCPLNCSCSIGSSGFNINCYSKYLGKIPDLPSDTFVLDLRFNSITEIDIQFCKEMPQLQTLYIANNQISEIPVNTFVNCEQLGFIDLSNNQLSEIPVNTFVNCAQLGFIAIYQNKMRSFESDTFINMTHLYELYLHYNEISTLVPFSLMNLPILRYLTLSHNKIRTLKSNMFINKTNLYDLQLQYNQISTIESFTFMNLLRLRYLYLQNNEISSIESFTFINLLSLPYLDLSRNTISHIKENAFGNLTSLSTLDLTGNPLNCDCSIFPFWSWLIEKSYLVTNARCSNETLVTSLQSSALQTCNPDNCQCFNGGKCVAIGNDFLCDCIGSWTGKYCQESQCASYDCGLGDCYIENVNGTAQCMCGDRYVNYCPAFIMFISFIKQAVS